MSFADFVEQDQDLYELLELQPDATTQDIRSAYMRIKSAYKKDSPALYTLISDTETEDLLRRIEQAYQVLSNPDRRKEYDRSHGALVSTRPEPSNPANVISIDRVPPMEDLGHDLDILIAPKTDFTGTSVRPSSPPSLNVFEPNEHSFPFLPSPFAAAPAAPSASVPAMPPKTVPVPIAPPVASPPRRAVPSAADLELAQEIENETEWRGTFLRMVREARGVPIEELSEFTKISKTYLLAVEDENYARLPAAVYMRGFVTQLAKYLKLPHERVCASYLARYAQVMLDKEKSKGR